MTQGRIQKFQKILKEKGLDGFVVTNPINIFYLCGFRGMSQTEREAFLVVDPKDAVLIAPRLYQKEALRLKGKGLKVKIAQERNELFPSIGKLIGDKKKIGFEKNDLKYGEYEELNRKFSTSSNSNVIANNVKQSKQEKIASGSSSPRNDEEQMLFALIPFKDLVEQMRQIKTADEIKKIEKAQLISQKAFDTVIKTIKIGQTEEEIAHNLSSIIQNLGGQGLAFESIIASGPNAGIPHHFSGKRKIKTNEVLLLDFGAKFQNYHADLSRTIFVGKAKDEHKNIFYHVAKAQQKAIKQIKKGTKTHEAFGIANKHFEGLKLDKFFLHGLGHGIGLEIHEEPYLRRSTESVLTEGMVFSVEPGLYFPWGGVRIEDLVVINDGKAKVLGKTQQDLIEL